MRTKPARERPGVFVISLMAGGSRKAVNGLFQPNTPLKFIFRRRRRTVTLELGRRISPPPFAFPDFLRSAVGKDAPIGKEPESTSKSTPEVPGVVRLIDRSNMSAEEDLSGSKPAWHRIAEANNTGNLMAPQNIEGPCEKPRFAIAWNLIQQDKAPEFYGCTSRDRKHIRENFVGARMRKHRDPYKAAAMVKAHAEASGGVCAGVMVCKHKSACGVVVWYLSNVIF